MKDEIIQKSENLFDYLVEVRRDLHAHPEVGLQEVRTSKKVAEELRKIGLDVQTGIGTTGVVGLLRGGSLGRTIAIRADMDALPVTEQTGLPFASESSGVMHACGHDGHVAMALGTARVLAELREKISGNVKFIMQPAEESYGGASDMVEEGVLQNPAVDAIIALHIDTHEPVGKLSLKSGAIGASVDVFMVSVNGKGGHSSEPQKSVDPIHVAAHAITALQTMITRTLDARDPVVLSVCSIQGGTAFNVIPDNVHFGGTVRTLSEEQRTMIPKRMEDIIRSVTATWGATFDFTYVHGAPVTANEPGMTDLMSRTAADLWGPESVVDMQKPHMGSEDYCYYLQKVPGAMGFLGAAKEGNPYPGHHPKFDFDERSLPLGVQILALTAVNFLNG
jgi:amidohydrolase